MPKCLGIYIEDNVIKYAKVDKNKDALKVESSNVVFYEKTNITQTLERIITETFSTKDPVSINISNEIYNYFEVFAALKPKDRQESIKLDFELLCSEKGYNKDSLDGRYIFRDSKDSIDKLKVLHIATNKENVHKRMQDFGNVKIVSAAPIATSIFNLVDLGPKDENVVIVNIENDTKVTTIMGGEIYNIDIISDGMNQILETINMTENSTKKSYECCKNTTIYTQDMQEQSQVEENEHLDEIMPTLYKIANEVKAIIDGITGQITKVYITGLGTVINNIDLYFQEYIPDAKCELLKPFFMENASLNVPIKEYIEVNSAISLALNGLGYGINELNFSGKNMKGSTVVEKSDVINFFKGLVDPKKELTAFDKTMFRLLACLCVGVVGYSLLSTSITSQIEEKQTEIETSTKAVTAQISTIDAQTARIQRGETTYQKLISALEAVKEGAEDEVDQGPVVPKYAIPNLLNKIVYAIPTQVQVTSIKNTENNHIVIEARAPKYDQLGYFVSVIITDGLLENVKASSGSRIGSMVIITIEGDLP